MTVRFSAGMRLSERLGGEAAGSSMQLLEGLICVVHRVLLKVVEQECMM